MLVGLKDTEPEATPVPDSDTAAPLVASVSNAVRRPAADGVKVTDALHVLLRVKLDVHELDEIAKSPEFVPVTLRLGMKDVVPVFVRVVFCALLVVLTFWFPYANVLGLNDPVGMLPDESSG